MTLQSRHIIWNARRGPGTGYAVLYVLLIVSALIAYWRTDTCTWNVGGYSWRLYDVNEARHGGELVHGLGEQDLTDEGFERLRTRMLYWLFYQNVWAWTSFVLAFVCLGLLLFRRDMFAAGTFAVSLLLAFESHGLTQIRF
jgi:hypothetical protein